MAVSVTTPHRPFDRLWQPGHPFRARRSRGRRWSVSLLLIFMSGVISSYWYLTDPQRIKTMSEKYLSELIGGPVEVGSASLTIFEGLKLSQVTVRVDNRSGPDSLLLIADAIEVQYNPSSLLEGKLQATRIIATSARVKLVEDSTGGRWNYQRLKPAKNQPSVTRPSESSLPPLPQVVLRDAKLEYSELRNGQCLPRGAMVIEGRAFPSGDGSRYLFEVQSRGALEGVGPVAGGQVALKNGEVTATLTRFKFGRDIEAMLPPQVREFWLAHQLQGSLDIPDFDYTPASPKHRATFRLETQLKHVKLIVRARELEIPDLADAEQPWLGRNVLIARVSQFSRRMFKLLSNWRVLPEQPPMRVDDVSGNFLFDENGVRFNRVSGSLGGATVMINGKIDGYSPDAPVRLRIESPKGQVIHVPANPDFLVSLPPPIRRAYFMLRPQGAGTVWIEIARDKPGGDPKITGELEIIDGAFNCIFFPYPVRGATGNIAFFPDKDLPLERVELRNVHGHGIIGGPNEHNDMRVDGWLGGGDPDAGCRIRARSDLIFGEPAVFQALPPQVRHVMTLFKGIEHEQYPRLRAGFDCEVFVPPGHEMRPIVSVDLNLMDGAGRFAAFPYPLEKLHGIVNIRDGYLDLHDVELARGGAGVHLNGRVTWPTDLPDGAEIIAKPNIRLLATNVPIDDELLKVLPPDARHWIRSAQVTGMLDVDGPIVPQPTARDAGAIGYHLGVTLRNAKAEPRNSGFVISDLAGSLVVHSDKVEVTELHGRRGDALLHGDGIVGWSSGQARMAVNATATKLALDEPLHKLLPESGRDAWSAVEPRGSVDLELFLEGAFPSTPADPVDSVRAPASAPVASTPLKFDDFKLSLHPRELSVTAQALPYRLDHCTGSVVIDPNDVRIVNFGGRHGKATVVVNGRGLTASPSDWDFTMTAGNVPTDADLIDALPVAMRQLLADLKVKGELNLDLKSMKYRGGHGNNPQPDIDLNGELHAAGAAMDVGMPLKDLNGEMGFNVAVRKGKLVAFRGDVGLDSVSFAERPVSGFKAKLDLPANSDTLQISGIQGQIAGGDVAGEVKVRLPEQGQSSYSMQFAVKNADVGEIAKQVAPKGQEVRGQVSASLALQGDWADPRSRRGRGDVLVSGKQIYQIPLMLGLMEVTNLSLPTTSPFSEGTARYLVEGQRVTFEQIQMRSSQMVMSGNGWLDFDTKKVRMNFTTENPRMPQLPIIHDLVAGARQELLQIQVRGTVQHPTVAAASLHTFTTTVDEVFSGSEK